MPELPEVQIMVDNMRRWTAAHRVCRTSLDDPKVLALGQVDWVERVHEAPLLHPHRRGKYACFDLGEHRWVVHFRMTGKLVRVAPGAAERPFRWALHLDDGSRVGMVDTRRLGTLHLFASAEACAAHLDARLGPEPWPQRRSADWWGARLRGARGPLKPALMNQSRVAGLGNIAVSEALWRAQLDPWARAGTLDSASLSHLAAAMHGFLAHTLATEAGDEIQYVNAGGPNPFQVYGQAGAPCPRCAAPIQRAVQSGRATFWCPACQAA